MRMPGVGALRKAEQTANRVDVPTAPRLPAGEFVRRTLEKATEDHLTAFAGNVALHALFAVFPLLLALLWSFAAAGASESVNTLLEIATTAMPDAVGGPIRDQLSYTREDQASGALTLSALIALALALWATASTVRAIMDATNVIYGVKEGRPLWKRFAIAFALSLVVMVLLVGALVLTIFGSRIAVELTEAAGLSIGFRWIWSVVTWPVIFGAVLTAFALTYYFAPDVEQRFRWVGRGSLIAVTLWVIFAILFSLYINRLAALDRTYGALAGIAVLMVYFYASAIILLLGAVMNQVLECSDPAGKGEGEKQVSGSASG